MLKVLKSCDFRTFSDIYRAIVESTAYGTRNIIETFKAGGMDINTVIATGGGDGDHHALPEQQAGCRDPYR